jgi:hypothetical protein
MSCDFQLDLAEREDRMQVRVYTYERGSTTFRALTETVYLTLRFQAGYVDGHLTPSQAREVAKHLQQSADQAEANKQLNEALDESEGAAS